MINKFSKLLLLLLAIATTSLHAENTIGIDVNRADVEIVGNLDLNALVNYNDGTMYLLTFNYLHTAGEKTESNNMTNVGFLAQSYFYGVEGLSLALGIEGVLASDFLAVPFVVKGTYDLPLIDIIPSTSFSLKVAFAPGVLSFRQAQNYLEFRTELDMEIISNLHLFTGYRNIDTKYETFDKTFNDSFYLGMKLKF